MSTIAKKITNTVKKVCDKNNVFIFDGDYLKALAFIHGIGKNNKVEQIKKMARKEGLKYDYNFECYMKPINKEDYANYRKEKDQFIDQYMRWKIRQDKTVNAPLSIK